MNCNEKYYRKVMGSIGLTMLLFLGLINVCGLAVFAFDYILIMLDIPEVPATIAYELFYGTGYTLSFMLPVLLLKSLLQKSSYSYIPMRMTVRFSPWAFLAFPAGIALIYSASYINMGMVSFFDYSSFSSEVLWGSDAAALEPYQIVLQFIVMCAVPGFCEEFLFRGAIMTNCMPFGRVNAILISSFLFAMMHQNAEQIFYTFIAGLFLAVLYDMTGSIWPGTVLHILNNFSSLIYGVIFEKYGYGENGGVFTVVFDLVILVLGLISLAILLMRYFTRKSDLGDGIFGKELRASDGYAAYPVAPKRAFKLFLTPSMIVFLIFATLQVVALIMMAVLYGIFA